MSSQQVSWWDVHEYVDSLLDEIKNWPMIGSPAWCALSDDDPAKLAAIYDAAQHWALRIESCQRQMAQTSRDVADAADWAAIGREAAQIEAFYKERPWLRRKRTA